MVLKLGATLGGAISNSFTGIPQFGQLSHQISSIHNISISSLLGSLCDFAFQRLLHSQNAKSNSAIWDESIQKTRMSISKRLISNSTSPCHLPNFSEFYSSILWLCAWHPLASCSFLATPPGPAEASWRRGLPQGDYPVYPLGKLEPTILIRSQHTH